MNIEIKKHRDQQKSQYEQGETSKDGTTKPRVTSRILFNKWQRQKEKDYQRWLKDQEYQRQLKKERYERKQAESHWNCPFFRHCWNEGLKLPTRHDCPECSNQYWEFRQSQINRWSIHAQNAYHHNSMDRCLKNKSIHDRLGKGVVDQDWADHEEGNNQREHVW